MEYQTSRDGGRLQRIAARLAQDPTVLETVKASTKEIRAGKFSSSLHSEERFVLHGQVESYREEEVEQTVTA